MNVYNGDMESFQKRNMLFYFVHVKSKKIKGVREDFMHLNLYAKTLCEKHRVFNHECDV